MIVYMLCERSNQLIGWSEMFTMGTDLKWPWDNGQTLNESCAHAWIHYNTGSHVDMCKQMDGQTDRHPHIHTNARQSDFIHVIHNFKIHSIVSLL